MKLLMCKMAAVLSTLCICIAAQASAASILMTYSGIGPSGSFSTSLEFEQDGPQGVLTLLNGARNGAAVMGLSAYAGADNIIDQNPPYVGYNGLSFWTVEGFSYNIYYAEPGKYFETNSSYNPDGYASTDYRVQQLSVNGVNAAAVPEVDTWALALLGIGIVGGILRTRQRARFARAK